MRWGATVGIIGNTWSRLARRQQRGVQSPDEWEEHRLGWVRANAPGHSFVDVGGMFKYVGEVAFMAEELGATSVTMVDVGDPDLIIGGRPELGTFNDKAAARNSRVRYVQTDLEDPEAPGRIGKHEVAFFSGVLYHTPNPYLQLAQMRRIVTDRMYLSTMTIPEIPGFPQACVFYPYLNDRDRAPYAAGYAWKGLVGIDSPIDETPMHGYANCWWGTTYSALEAMLRAARFEVVERFKTPSASFQTDIVCRPVPGDPMLPPVEYFRWRSEARDRGEPRLPFDGWYEHQRATGTAR